MDKIIRKNNRRAELRLRRIIVLSLLALLILGLVFGAIKLCSACRTSSSKRMLPFSAKDEYTYTGGGFLYTQDNLLKYLDIVDERQNLSVELVQSNPRLAGKDDIKVVYSATSLQVVGAPVEHVIDGAIQKIVCGGKYVGAYIENADNSHSLYVYNSAGDLCHRTDLGSSVLLDFGFEGGESTSMYMANLVTSGTAVSTTVTTFDLALESITGVLNVPGEIVKKVVLSAKSVFMLGTDSLIRFDRSTNSEAYRLLLCGYECADFSLSGSSLMLMLSNIAEPAAPLRVLSIKEADAPDDRMLELASDTDAKACFLMQGKIVSVTDSYALIRSMSGDITSRIPLGINADSAQRLDERSVLLRSDDSLTLFTLNNF